MEQKEQVKYSRYNARLSNPTRTLCRKIQESRKRMKQINNSKKSKYDKLKVLRFLVKGVSKEDMKVKDLES